MQRKTPLTYEEDLLKKEGLRAPHHTHLKIFNH